MSDTVGGTNKNLEEPIKKQQVVLAGHPTHPVALAIETYIHAARDIKFAVRTFMPLAEEVEITGRKRVGALFEEADSLMKSGDASKRINGAKLGLHAIRSAARHRYSDVASILEESLFLSLFSAFDVFTGDLLRAICTRKPKLLDALNRSIPLSEVISAPSIESLKAATLDLEIENFRRKSYSEQFESLEKWFGIPLKKFDNWPAFIEASQRRNLITHCGGVVSEQYREACKREGVPTLSIASTGERLRLGPDYLLPACELMMEVALKLGQTIWRKVLPDELSQADEHLHNAVYDALLVEQWTRAETFGGFFAAQNKHSSDLKRRMAVVNLAIALKELDKTDQLRDLLGNDDWSATLPEFHLAEAVLFCRYDDAALIMLSIGRQGQILTQQAYHTWPLFNRFRETTQFQESYQQVYGYPFVEKVQENTAQAIRELTEGVETSSSPSQRLGVSPSEL